MMLELSAIFIPTKTILFSFLAWRELFKTSPKVAIFYPFILWSKKVDIFFVFLSKAKLTDTGMKKGRGYIL